MRTFNKVAIIGTGLIGGSIALAIKKKRLARQIAGVSRHKNTLIWAKRIHAIDKGSQQLGIIKDADLIILATPVETILNLAGAMREYVKPGCIVTDVGSTKSEIVSKLSKIFPYYVGSHPLAGSEKRGIANADADMFKNSLCILTPTKVTNTQALDKMKKFWIKLGARVAFLNPHTHDRILSFVSHLPHAIAFSLIDIIPKKYLNFGATSLKDSTRIALSGSRLWADIFLSNRENVLKSIESFQQGLFRIKSLIDKKDEKGLIKILEKAKARREILE